MSKNYGVIGAALTVLMIIMLASATERYGATFPEPIMSGKQLVNTTDVKEIVGSMSGFIWDYRSLDLIIQTLVLFATATGCTAMLRILRRKK